MCQESSLNINVLTVLYETSFACHLCLCCILQTREELREALENEMRGFNVDRELGSSCIIGWNHQEFEVQYHCLSEEIKIGRLTAGQKSILGEESGPFAEEEEEDGDGFHG